MVRRLFGWLSFVIFTIALTLVFGLTGGVAGLVPGHGHGPGNGHGNGHGDHGDHGDHGKGSGHGSGGCQIDFDVQGATSDSNRVVCRDGDPCDAGPCGDNSCIFRVRVCIDQTEGPQCTAAPSRRTARLASPLIVPTVASGDSACGAFTDITVPVKTGKGKGHNGKERLRVRTVSGGKPKHHGRTTLVLVCAPRGDEPCPTGTTTTTTVRTTTSTTSAGGTSTTTTTMVTGSIQCCVRSSATGAFDSCVVATPAECSAQNGVPAGREPAHRTRARRTPRRPRSRERSGAVCSRRPRRERSTPASP